MNDLFTSLYELFGYIPDFSDALYETGVNFPVGVLMLIISAVGMAVYYYVIDHPKFVRWYNWFFVVCVLAIINFGIAWAMSDGALYNHFQEINQDIPYGMMDFLTYALVNATWTVAFTFIFSMCMKWGSTNCKRTPF